VRPELRDKFAWATNRALRAEIAHVVPLYAGIETLATTGDSVQWGGRHLAPGGAFPTPNGRGKFSAVSPAPVDLPDGAFFVSTRRGKQFNSMVFAEKDPLNGARRHDVLIDAADARGLHLRDGDAIVLRSAHGEYRGHARVARLPQRTVQVHWPEANVLIGDGPREPRSRIPDYNAVVTIEKA
jgi:predicted molibdopterin-dependent oxidoreductase YjgC